MDLEEEQFALDLSVYDNADDDWLNVPMDFSLSAAANNASSVSATTTTATTTTTTTSFSSSITSTSSTSSSSSGPSVLLSLPLTLLARCCSFLEWSDLQAVFGSRVLLLMEAARASWVSILRNSWASLHRARSFNFSRLKSSGLLGSVDQLAKGVVSARVRSVNLSSAVSASLENIDTTPLKQRRLNRPLTPKESTQRQDDILLAALITVMFQSLTQARQFYAPELSALCMEQLRAPLKISPETQRRVDELTAFFRLARRALKQYRKKVIIPASHLPALRKAQEEIECAEEEFNILLRGWQYAQNLSGATGKASVFENDAGPPAGIIIRRQLFGGLFRNNQNMPEWTVQFIAAPSVASSIKSISRCMISCLSVEEGESLTEFLAHNLQDFREQGVADFSAFQFTKPTRQKLVKLVFHAHMKLENSPEEIRITSRDAAPLLVYAHQKQFIVSFASVVTHYAFGSDLEIPWPKFVNVFQEIFCLRILSGLGGAAPSGGNGSSDQQKASAQTTNVRGLSATDWEYMATRFFHKASTISRNSDALDQFFAFVSPFMFSLCFNRDYVSLWETGFIAGFMPRESVDLKPFGPGAFLLRYSTNVPGELVVSYCSGKGDTTKHYLINDGDVSPKSKQSLGIFLWKTPALKHILRMQEVNGEYSSGKLQKIDKEDCLSSWVSKEHRPVFHKGYELSTK